MSREEFLTLAREANLSCAITFDYRGEFENMTTTEQDDFSRMERFAALVEATIRARSYE